MRPFYTVYVDFDTKELELGFTEIVRIDSIRNGHKPDSPEIPFSPTDVTSDKFELEFLHTVPPHEPNLMIWFQAENKPIFTKVIFHNKKKKLKRDFEKVRLDSLNGH